MNIDIKKTAAYYHTLKADDLCSCNYCRNFRKYIRTTYPETCLWLHSLGIEAEKAMETSPLERDEQGYIEYYGCQYVAFGSCESDFQHQIGNVLFRKACSHPQTGITEPHFVLECFPIRLPADKELL